MNGDRDALSPVVKSTTSHKRASDQRLMLRQVNRRIVKVLILFLTAGLSLVALTVPIAARTVYYPLRVGDVATQDIQAPYALSFPSPVMTDQMRQDAEQRISPVYLAVSPAIARHQVERLRSALNFISIVRADRHATLDQKVSDLSALSDVPLDQTEAGTILNLGEASWQTAQQEALSVLEEIMRETIRDEQVGEMQRRIPNRISFSFSQELVNVVTVIASPFVVANSLYSEEQTVEARRQALERVEPITRSFVTGEAIVRRGQIVTSANWEALVQFGLIAKPNNLRDQLSAGVLVACLALFTALYFSKRRVPFADGLRGMAVMGAAFVVFLVAARMVIVNRTVLPYAFPIPAFGLTVASLFTAELGMLLSLLLSIVTAFHMPNSLDLTLYYTISSLFGIVVLGRGQRVVNFMVAGVAVGAAGSAVILAYRLADPSTDLVGLATLIGVAFFNGIVSASLTLILQYLFAQLLGLTTALQLLEASRPDHPLQQFILQNAPGSYQHSLQVAIMAEQAAESIGADALLVRVGAIYHDAGKAANPSFFIENQVSGKLNPHDDLDPLVSAQTIIRHVPDGVALGRKHHLPQRIIDFMREHHGNAFTRYQYARALENAQNDASAVDIESFRYPGPRPQSRETALLMLADGAQARARAELPQNEIEMREIVRKVIDFCQREGQLDDTRLTLRDLNLISESFVRTLQNTYHPRIRYPDMPPRNRTTDPHPQTLPVAPALKYPELEPSPPISPVPTEE